MSEERKTVTYIGKQHGEHVFEFETGSRLNIKLTEGTDFLFQKGQKYDVSGLPFEKFEQIAQGK